MATFKVELKDIVISEHPNADALEIAQVDGYTCIVQKGLYDDCTQALYIPEQAVMPEYLIERMGLTGRLAGKQHNRVKAIRLRGVFSQGLLHPVEIIDGVPHIQAEDETIRVEYDTDYKEALGIEKYEPEIPAHMGGEVDNRFGYTMSYDIENYKRFPDALEDGEDVVFHEKLHGTWTCFGYHPDVPNPIVTSKGLSGRGLAFKWFDDPADVKNLYMLEFLKTYDDKGKNVIDRINKDLYFTYEPFYILGETFGQGVQDLHYSGKRSFRVFDVYVGNPGQGEYLSHDALDAFCTRYGLDRVPMLYRGPFSIEVMNQYTDGKETVSGNESHIREGIVMRPSVERKTTELSRVQLKSISEAYLLRKGSATEYQ